MGAAEVEVNAMPVAPARTRPGIRTTRLPSGEAVPVLGQGTWHLAEDPRRRKDEIAALNLGIDLGMTLIDTAEMYADGAAEVLAGEAIAGRRKEVFLVGKVLPDLYLLHWRGAVPLEETLDAFKALVRNRKIRYWGVSNFDTPDMVELWGLPGGEAVATDQVLYNLARRGIEHKLLPWCRERRIPIMAYSPIEEGRLLRDAELHKVAARHHVTPAQVALAWVLRMDGVIGIPKASTTAHVRQNRAALELRLTQQDLMALDHAFPPPSGPQPLEML